MMGGEEEEEKEREPSNRYMYLYIGRRKKGVRFWKQHCATIQGSTARRSWSMHLQVQYCFHGREKRFWTLSISMAQNIYQLPGNISPADFGRPLIERSQDRLAFEAGPLSKIFGRGDGGQTLDAANEYLLNGIGRTIQRPSHISMGVPRLG
jgi:hypothetical protein